MRIEKQLRKERETLLRFLDVFGGGSAALGAGNKYAQPGFFVLGCTFIQEYVEPVFFRKVDLLLSALENSGFPTGSGAIAAMKSDQIKCKESAELLLKAVKDWQGGDVRARLEVSWASSEFNTTLRQIMERLKNLIFPLLEQNMSPEEMQQILDDWNKITSEGSAQNERDPHIKQIEALEDELSDWK